MGAAASMGMAKREPAPIKMANQELAPSGENLTCCPPVSSYLRPYPLRFPLKPPPYSFAPPGVHPGVHRPALSTQQMPNPIPLPRHPALPHFPAHNNEQLRMFKTGIPLSLLSRRRPKSSEGPATWPRPSASRPCKRAPSRRSSHLCNKTTCFAPTGDAICFRSLP